MPRIMAIRYGTLVNVRHRKACSDQPSTLACFTVSIITCCWPGLMHHVTQKRMTSADLTRFLKDGNAVIALAS